MIHPALTSSEREDWATPAGLVRAAARLLDCGAFDLDPAADEANAKAPAWYSKTDDGLAKPWHGRVWLNPPWSKKTHSKIDPWVSKSVEETTSGRATIVAALLPARVDVRWWHRWVVTFAADVHMIEGRVRYVAALGVETKGNGAVFPSALVVWRHGVSGPPRYHSWRPSMDDDDSAKGDEGVAWPVQELRLRLHLSQPRLAWLLAVDTATISRWESLKLAQAGRKPTQTAAWLLDELRGAVLRHGWAQVEDWTHRARYTRGEVWARMLS